jgi:hypothetical protein
MQSLCVRNFDSSNSPQLSSRRSATGSVEMPRPSLALSRSLPLICPLLSPLSRRQGKENATISVSFYGQYSVALRHPIAELSASSPTRFSNV